MSELERNRPMNGSASTVEVARAVFEILAGQMTGPVALATVIDRSGSAPQVVGAKLLLQTDGSLIGTVGGGAIEAEVLRACRKVLRCGQSMRVRANLVHDLGMCCGGTMEVFVEYLQAQARLFIVGAGHVAQALTPLAITAGFRVRVFDDREELLSHPAFIDCTTANADVDELVPAIADLGSGLSAADYVLIATRDHQRDERALAVLVGERHRYLGMLGSRRKVYTVLRRIIARADGLGHADPDFSRVHAPVGLALGGRTPVEIAVSIIAEMLADRHGMDGGSMSIVGDVVGGAPRETEIGAS